MKLYIVIPFLKKGPKKDKTLQWPLALYIDISDGVLVSIQRIIPGIYYGLVSHKFNVNTLLWWFTTFIPDVQTEVVCRDSFEIVLSNYRPKKYEQQKS